MPNILQKQRRLGRGLNSLIGEPVSVNPPAMPLAARSAPNGDATGSSAGKAESGADRLRRLPIDSVSPGRFQPRRAFDQASLARLADSIRTAGVMQPIVVRPARMSGDGSGGSGGSGGGVGGDGGGADGVAGVRGVGGVGGAGGGGGFELVAGERRWRAAALAGLREIPAIVADLSDEETAEFGLIENLQRDDLGPMERAWALRNLCERFNLTHADAATRLGLERASVSNLVRLTELEPKITALIDAGELGVGHAKILLTIAPGRRRIELAGRAAAQAWSVRKLEDRAQLRAPSASPDSPAHAVTEAGAAEEARRRGLHDLERQLGEHLGTRVRISADRSGRRGRISIQFFDLDHFDGLMARFGFQMR